MDCKYVCVVLWPVDHIYLQFQNDISVDCTIREHALQLVAAMRQRFACILDTTSSSFLVLPAVACLLDPSTSLVLMSADKIALRGSANDSIIQMVSLI